jgi:hypothetical protein
MVFSLGRLGIEFLSERQQSLGYRVALGRGRARQAAALLSLRAELC